MKKILKFILVILGFRYVLRLMDENVDIKIAATKSKSNHQKVILETNLSTRFNKFNKKSNLSRAPPLN